MLDCVGFLCGVIGFVCFLRWSEWKFVGEWKLWIIEVGHGAVRCSTWFFESCVV